MIGKWIIVEDDTRLVLSVNGCLVSEDCGKSVIISHKVGRHYINGIVKKYEDFRKIKKSKILKTYNSFEECVESVLKINNNCEQLLNQFSLLKQEQSYFISETLEH